MNKKYVAQEFQLKVQQRSVSINSTCEQKKIKIRKKNLTSEMWQLNFKMGILLMNQRKAANQKKTQGETVGMKTCSSLD